MQIEFSNCDRVATRFYKDVKILFSSYLKDTKRIIKLKLLENNVFHIFTPIPFTR